MSTPPRFGKNIEQLRRQRGLSLDSLAERSQVSKAMLSQIEKGKVNPTIGILWKIAEGLNVQLRDLISSEPASVLFEIKEKSGSTILLSDDGRCEIQVLSPPKMIESVELYLLHFQSGGKLQSQAHSPHTEEIITAIEGELEIRSGNHSAKLTPYMSLHYSADVPHMIRNAGRGEAKAYLAVRYQ
ncbi:helix-turn-helix transcriptional regulator [Candidatus Sumerlaeota bacterium]|nr:helix-turn-helix transcriptional regulator [Candidatus Sumerlaeota bacterium]MBI3735191.1 helix-turn-helix transcriptional regulator [Candidatus Sumerlaeota bacterium]